VLLGLIVLFWSVVLGVVDWVLGVVDWGLLEPLVPWPALPLACANAKPLASTNAIRYFLFMCVAPSKFFTARRAIGVSRESREKTKDGDTFV